MEETAAVVKSDEPPQKENFRDRILRHFTLEPKSEESSEAKVEDSSEAKVEDSSEATNLPTIFMVRTENLIHEPFKQTEELKVSCVGISCYEIFYIISAPEI